LSKNEFESGKIEFAEVVLKCVDLNETLEFFTVKLGFQVHSIFPADNPREVFIRGFGLNLRLVKVSETSSDITLRLNVSNRKYIRDKIESLKVPNGIRIELSESNPSLEIPEHKSSLVINRLDENDSWIIGRAGMRYRDLIPDRQGGRFIASHIHIPEAGLVPDYVHFHNIHFQMIYCYKGWAKLVYEDQGKPFMFNAGDCVLQPPKIRHRVLESSENLEVIEISCPAEHETFADYEMDLPTPEIDTNRLFNGQQFVHHKTSDAVWKIWRIDGFEGRDAEIAKATNGLANVSVIRRTSKNAQKTLVNDSEFLFMFILNGDASLRIGDNSRETLQAGDSIVIPAVTNYTFFESSENLEFLEVKIS